MEPIPNGLLHDYGDDWQIERDAGTEWLKAIERPVAVIVNPVLRNYIAETETQLRELLDNDRLLHGGGFPRPSGWTGDEPPPAAPRPTDQGSQ